MLYSEKLKEILTKFSVDTSKLPNNLYSTMLDAVSNCSSQNAVDTLAQMLTGTLEHYESDAITTIPNYQKIANCGLKSLVLPNLTYAGSNCFESTTLENVVIGNPNIEFDTDRSFLYSTALKKVEFLSSKVTLHIAEFQNSKLEYLIFRNVERAVQHVELNEGATVVYPDSLVGYWKTMGNWSSNLNYMTVSEYDAKKKEGI